MVVAPDEQTARELAAGYGLWVRSIRSGEVPCPSLPPITTITHDHADRVRSYELLAQEWHRR